MGHEKVLYSCAFFIPIFVLCIGFAISGVYPFGDRSALVVDGENQYMTFFIELLHQLKTGSSWTHSVHAMGYDFYSVFCYYLSSPFTLLVLALNHFLYINEALTLVILIKIGIAGVSMCWYAAGKISDHAGKALCFGMMYALSNYVTGYYANHMWLDAVMILPFLAGMTEKLIHMKKWKAYTFLLAYCLIANYYMAFMVCIFIGLYFIAVCAAMLKKEEIINRIFLFVKATFLSIGMAAVILFPSIFSVLQSSAAQEMKKDILYGTYGTVSGQLSEMFFGAYSQITSSGQDMINGYCGSAVLFFVALYLVNRKIRWREKLPYIMLTVFYFLGFHVRIINLFLHGFHVPVGMPNRFAFIFIFLILRISVISWKEIKNCSFCQVIFSATLSMLFVIGIGMHNEEADLSVTLYVLGMIFVMALFSQYHTVNLKHLKMGFSALLCILILTEMSVHAVLSICEHGMAGRNLWKEKGEELVKLRKTVEEQEDFDTQYRMILVDPDLRNEELLWQFNGGTLFSSTVTQKQLQFMKKTGTETGENRYQYTGTSELMDMLLGVKYLIWPKNMKYTSAYQKISETDLFTMYENPYALKNAYGVSDELQNLVLDGANPFEVQEELLQKLGCCESLYDVRKVESLGKNQKKETARKMFAQNLIPGNFSGETDSPMKTFEITIKAGEHGYLYLSGEEPETVKIDGRVQQSSYWNNNFLDLGYAETDRKITVVTDRYISSALLGTYPETRLEKIYKILSENQMDFQEGNGTINLKEEKVLLLNSFYQEKMKIVVDGKETEVLDLAGLCGVKLTEGVHTVTAEYPVSGLKEGSIVSGICWIWYLIFLLVKRKKSVL